MKGGRDDHRWLAGDDEHTPRPKSGARRLSCAALGYSSVCKFLNIHMSMATLGGILGQPPGRITDFDWPGFYSTWYAVDVSANLREDGSIIWPAKAGGWEVTLTPLTDDAELMRTPLLGGLVSAVRGSIRHLRDPNPSASKTGPNRTSTISLTVAIKEGKIVQFYVLQKKLWYVWRRDYAGSWRFVPVVEIFMEQGVDMYNCDAEAVLTDNAHVAEATGYWAAKCYLGQENSGLMLQMPLMRVPFGGLHPLQKKAIRALDLGHPMRMLLFLQPGEELPVAVINLG